MNRRSLIQLATAAAAAFQDNAIERLKAAASGTEGKTPEEVAKDEDYWAEVRGAFSIDRKSGKLTALNQQTSGGDGPC